MRATDAARRAEKLAAQLDRNLAILDGDDFERFTLFTQVNRGTWERIQCCRQVESRVLAIVRTKLCP